MISRYNKQKPGIAAILRVSVELSVIHPIKGESSREIRMHPHLRRPEIRTIPPVMPVQSERRELLSAIKHLNKEPLVRINVAEMTIVTDLPWIIIAIPEVTGIQVPAECLHPEIQILEVVQDEVQVALLQEEEDND